MNTTRDLLLTTALLAIAGCGDDQSLICEPGTFASGADCVAVDPDDATAPTTTADAPGGRRRAPLPERVTLTSNEPATIYVTTDGSEPDPAGAGEPSPVLVPRVTPDMTLKFFAVDAAGNREATQTLTFVSDVEGPARPGLALAVAGLDATLTITPPTVPDYAGTVLARITGELDAVPEPGTFYTAGQDLSPSVRIVTAGTTTTFADPGRTPGVVRYAAWSHDDLGNYSAPRILYATLGVGSLTGSVSIDTATNTVTFPAQLANVPLSATATASGGGLTVDLTLTNQTTKTFQAPKLVITNVTGGNLQGTDGTVDGSPYRTFGPEALAPGAAPTRQISFSGVAADATVTFDVELKENPLLVWSGHPNEQTRLGFVDMATSPPSSSTTFEAPVRGPGNSRGAHRQGCASVDGRYSFTGNQHYGRVERYDLTTRASAGGVYGAAVPAFVSDVACDGKGTVYAVLAGGGRRNNGSAVTQAGLRYQVVRYTEGLIETGRVSFEGPTDRGMAYPALSPDGSVIAVATQSEVVLVDTDTMTVIPTTVGGAAAVLGTSFQDRGIRHLLWSADGQTLYAQAWWSTGLVRFDFTGSPRLGVATRTVIDGASNCCNRSGEIALAPDGKVWIANDTFGLRSYDPATGTVSPSGYSGSPRGLEWVGGRLHVIRGDRNTIDVLDASGGVVRAFGLPFSSQQHRLGATR